MGCSIFSFASLEVSHAEGWGRAQVVVSGVNFHGESWEVYHVWDGLVGSLGCGNIHTTPAIKYTIHNWHSFPSKEVSSSDKGSDYESAQDVEEVTGSFANGSSSSSSLLTTPLVSGEGYPSIWHFDGYLGLANSKGWTTLISGSGSEGSQSL